MTFNEKNFLKYKFFDVDVTFLDYPDILEAIFNSPLRTFTCVNQYYLNLVYEDEQYGTLLKSFDMIHPDGIGIIFAKKILFRDTNKVIRINGSDLYLKIIDRLHCEDKNIFLLGDLGDVVEKSCTKIKELYPGIKVQGIHHGYIDLDDERIIETINHTNSFLLMVGLGSKRQEYWIHKWSGKLNVEKIVVVGGGFRIISNDRARGPVWIQNLGLEWLVRLITEPKKYWIRYLIGIPLFFIRIIKYKKLINIPMVPK